MHHRGQRPPVLMGSQEARDAEQADADHEEAVEEGATPKDSLGSIHSSHIGVQISAQASAFEAFDRWSVATRTVTWSVHRVLLVEAECLDALTERGEGVLVRQSVWPPPYKGALVAALGGVHTPLHVG
jgi:hypothetical protein